MAKFKLDGIKAFVLPPGTNGQAKTLVIGISDEGDVFRYNPDTNKFILVQCLLEDEQKSVIHSIGK